MNPLKRFKYFLWFFGHFKVPLIGYTRPRIIDLTDERIVVKIALRRRTKNHLNSMYFGALAIGADIAGGLHGFYHAELINAKTSLAFKSFEAQFLSRPESDVYFVNEMGLDIKKMLEESQAQSVRINKPIIIKAYTDYERPEKTKEVARFMLELSLKVIS